MMFQDIAKHQSYINTNHLQAHHSLHKPVYLSSLNAKDSNLINLSQNLGCYLNNNASNDYSKNNYGRDTRMFEEYRLFRTPDQIHFFGIFGKQSAKTSESNVFNFAGIKEEPTIDNNCSLRSNTFVTLNRNVDHVHQDTYNNNFKNNYASQMPTHQQHTLSMKSLNRENLHNTSTMMMSQIPVRNEFVLKKPKPIYPSLPVYNVSQTFDTKSSREIANNQPMFQEKILLCVFCKKRGNPEKYLGHRVADDFNRCTCPTLRQYTCPICGASGDNAHTKLYCPKKNNLAMAEWYHRYNNLNNTFNG